MHKFILSPQQQIVDFASSIKTIGSIITYANDIIEFVEKFHDIDPICKISIKDPQITFSSCKSTQTAEPKHVISGSKAVTTFLELLREAQKTALKNGVKGCGPFLKLAEHFKANDTDVFFLDSKEISRLKYDNVDIVHIKVPTITEHLNNFDLSCCKTSMNIEGTTFWVSLHCIYTMLTGNCFIPKYLESPDKFRKVYNKENNITPKEIFKLIPENSKLDKCDTMFVRIGNRIKKYKDRGYTFQYIETEVPLSCISSNHMSSYVGGY